VNKLDKIAKLAQPLKKPYVVSLTSCLFAICAYSLAYLIYPYTSYESGLILAIVLSLFIGLFLGFAVTFINKELSRQLKINKANNDTKAQLIHILSHDIKGPLTNIRHILDMLRKDNISQEEMRSLFNELDNDTLRTLKLTNNLVGWIKIQNRNYRPNYELQYIEELVTQTIELYQNIASKKNISIDHKKDEDLSFYTDREMYKIALRNLISNAVKYTKEDGRIEISYSIENDKLTTYVKDTGVGIKPDKLKSILSKEHLIQSSPGTNKEKGTGIGLHLSKSIIEKLDGYFGAESIPEKGSCFYFSLPIVNASKP